VGTGSGGYGNGDGDGGDESPPRWRSGRLKDSDYPKAAGVAGISGTVSVRYTVETNGRVTGCLVTRSSGSAALDDTTCRLIEKRFRFEPSRDAQGRAVRSMLEENHEWAIDQQPPQP
jgi:protein TonB